MKIRVTTTKGFIESTDKNHEFIIVLDEPTVLLWQDDENEVTIIGDTGARITNLFTKVQPC